MATIKQLLDPEQREDAYALKDRLKVEQILEQDPMQLNRTRFEKYLTAKAEALIQDALDGGDSSAIAYLKARVVLKDLDADWRLAARAYNLSK